MKKKTHRLSFKSEHDYILIGISSHENDYRVCWAINNDLGTNFVKTENLKIFNQKLSASQEFSLYIYENEDSLNRFHLVANRCENGYYIPELKNIDFFLQIFGDTADDYINELIKRIKGLDIITGVFLIDPEILRSKDRLEC